MDGVWGGSTNRIQRTALPTFVWDGFGAGLAYPKGLNELFEGDFDGSSPLRAIDARLVL
jgi:hypothetical protein